MDKLTLILILKVKLLVVSSFEYLSSHPSNKHWHQCIASLVELGSTFSPDDVLFAETQNDDVSKTRSNRVKVLDEDEIM